MGAPEKGVIRNVEKKARVTRLSEFEPTYWGIVF
jgi:hypothetical protein